MGKTLSNKYGQKSLDSAKTSTRNAIKNASKRAIQKTAEATRDLIGNKITSVSKKSPNELHNNETEVSRASPKDILRKDVYLQKKDKKLLMNLGQYNNTIIEYQKKANLLNNASNQLSQVRTNKWVKIIDESRATYAANKQIKFKTSLLRSSLCDY